MLVLPKMSSAISITKVIHSLLFLLYFSNTTRSLCDLKLSTSHFICKNTSVEDYVYDILQMDHTAMSDNSSEALEFTIINSNFPALVHLQDPFEWTYGASKVSKLVLNSCKITVVSKGAFRNFRNLDEIDLAFNQIKDLGFIDTSISAVSKLNLSHNNIESVDFHPFTDTRMTELDLSFNLIVQVMILPSLSGLVLLNNNNIEIVELVPSNSLRVNLANNKIKYFIKTYLSGNYFDYLDLSGSISNSESFLGSFPESNESNISNNPVVKLPEEVFFTRYLHASNCSFSIISIPSFPNYSKLNFSHNQIKIVKISNKNFIAALDLSYNHLENITMVFHGATIIQLDLSHNKIKQLNSNSFPLEGELISLNISFNSNLELTGGTFKRCNVLQILSLASCDISVLEESVFTGLIQLNELDLNHNQLQVVSAQLFKPLRFVRRINLSHNKLSIIPSQIFSFLNSPLLSILDLSENNIEIIESVAFENLVMNSITMNHNRGSVAIRNSSFFGSIINSISMRNCQFNSIDFEVFSGMQELLRLDLSYSRILQINHSYGTSNINIKNLNLTFKGRLQKNSFQNLPFLSSLVFHNSTLETIEADAFRGLFSLKSLQLSESTVQNISSHALDSLFGIVELDTKTLFGNAEILPEASFRHLRSLFQLDLSGLHLNDIEPWAFKGLKRLQHLNLSANSLTLLRTAVFFGLEELQVLDLSENRLRVLHSDIFDDLTGLKTLHLDSNEINDINLGALQGFGGLLDLSFARNKLTLFKVGAFSNLLQLKNLNLQRNSISSLLFEAFLPLKSLETLNLEYNNLKTIEHISLVSNLRSLRRIGIANNKWRCDYLAELLITFKNRLIDYSSENWNFLEDNIDGIKCIDVCKFLLCLKDSHGIN
ncbi:insulin-like growth factor-binding protein complex acid labile subunit [Euwallacea fornicatus]|uniref:insulin-like growth factor-binding protein complex acid labile subunit n=1 Tax=Euwallacea fornicatus TaxID=995702 RepID=UPI00338F618B